ncbi:MAG: BON domain-containing protein [Casimicrobiaceae bacterium]
MVCRNLIAVTLAVALAPAAGGTDLVQLDPFAQATAGLAACAPARPRLLTAQESGAEAHARSERGTRCGMEGTCEPGGAYKRDPEINERVRAAIADDRRFADTSVWVTTSRRWATLEGCVRTSTQRRALVRFVAKLPKVERVFDELRVGARLAAR